MNMSMSRVGAVSLLFTTLALSGCKYTYGTADGKLAADLTCKSDVLGQTVILNAGGTLYSYETNDGQPYYGLTRKFEETSRDKAVTTTMNTTVEIKMYDHDRWVCTDTDGAFVDYKSAPTNS